MPLRFGTDGIRGEAASLTPRLVVALGQAAHETFPGDAPFLIGRDTRESGPAIAAWLAAGLEREGRASEQLGVLPTPAVAFASQRLEAPAAMISASHNRYSDNGIKLFAPGGRKLDDDEQRTIEARLDALVAAAPDRVGLDLELSSSDGAIATSIATSIADEYTEHVVESIDGRRLDGIHVVLDCAHGAAVDVAPRTFAALGARVQTIGAAPDGRNINEGCGSNHPELLQRAVVAAGADLGLAFDGDADRCIAIDADGAIVDGDQLIVALALDLDARDRLADRTVVVTVMSNLGLHHALAAQGITVHETAVGDRNVLVALEAHGWVLGGEQSGHVILRDRATTGDGLLTGVAFADIVIRRDRSVHELAGAMTHVPQLLESVLVTPGFALDAADALWREVRAIEAELGESGRVLVRPSGTEPVVRLMVEAPTERAAHDAIDRLRVALGT